ncbi:MAG: InlB B-repeat-containing protein [Bacilli bacterium]|nr:InlB B-repeat-containing protein [Bacilli bacterium]
MKKTTRFLMIIISLVLAVFIFSSVKTKALDFTKNGFAWSISTQFGEDAATSTGIHWLSEKTDTYAMFGLSNDSGDFSNAKRYDPVCTQVILTDDKLTDDMISGFPETFYECELDIDGLEPRTRYMYYVTDGVNRSDVYRFTTAPNDGETAFSFGYVNDPQVYGAANSSNTNWERWVLCCKNFVNDGIKQGTPIDFIMGGGDMVNNGGDADHWAMIFNNPYLLEMQYFSTCGNHEYNSAKNNYETWKSRFYECQYNNPDNGYPEAEYHDVTCYWKYGDTLFISLASCENKAAQVPWLENVILNNPAQWIICVVHMNPLSTNSGATAREFVPMFDKYGVDLVLFGDEHVYKIYDNYNNFAQVPSSQSGTYYYEQVATSTYYNYREGTVAVSAKITVNNEAITISMYDLRGDVVNQKVLYPRRPATKDIIEFDETKFVKTLKVSVDQNNRNNATLSWGDMAYSNVKTITLKTNDKVLMSGVVNSTSFSSISTSTLTPDIDYDAVIEYTLKDGTVKTVDYDFTTKLSIFGTLEDISFNDSTKGYSIYFKKMTLRDEVDSLKLYLNGKYLNDVEKGARKVFVPREELIPGENIIQIVTVVGEKEYLLEEFIYENEVVEVKYNITYDLDGGAASNMITEFTDSTTVTLPTPTKEGYKFLGWYDGETLITSLENKDYNLKAKWEKIEEEPPVPTDPEPTNPEPVGPEPTPSEPKEEPKKSGCNSGAIVGLLQSIALLALAFFVRKKH